MRERLRVQLLGLGAHLGDSRGMAIFGEGNISARIDDNAFLVKASGTSLAELGDGHVVEVRSETLLRAVEGDELLSDEAVEQLLLDARIDEHSLKPSVESLFHAWLLGRADAQFVGHVHGTAVNQVLCSPAAQQFARKRLFPDQIVYCGAESVLIPYVDPGLTLARRIAAEVDAFRMRTGRFPTTILLENHGIIALGNTAREVHAALAMAEKAATVFVGAAALGGPVYMSGEHVRRIAERTDEHYRQRILRET